MGLFRTQKISEADAIAAFWQWWDTIRDDVAAAVTIGDVERFAPGLGGHVNAINSDLQWELTPGGSSAHALVVTAAGKPALRSAAARWLGAAPPADQTWSYRSLRTADLAAFEATMQIDNQTLALADIRYGISVDQDRRQIDVTCYHSAFDGLPDNVRGQITFLTSTGRWARTAWRSGCARSAGPPPNRRTPRRRRICSTP